MLARHGAARVLCQERFNATAVSLLRDGSTKRRGVQTSCLPVQGGGTRGTQSRNGHGRGTARQARGAPEPSAAAVTADGFELPRGFLLIDKPPGISSNQVLSKVKQLLGVRLVQKRRQRFRIGHGGTLDPFATGLLMVAAGRDFTALLGHVLGASKEYTARLVLGVATDTLDLEGAVTERAEPPPPLPEVAAVVAALDSFLGPCEQVVPDYSAKKFQGQPGYALARSGRPVPRRTSSVVVHAIHLDALAPTCPELPGHPQITFTVRCSKGTYVRSLGADIAARLGTHGHLVGLRRSATGAARVEDAITLDALTDLSDAALLKAGGVRDAAFFKLWSSLFTRAAAADWGGDAR